MSTRIHARHPARSRLHGVSLLLALGLPLAPVHAVAAQNDTPVLSVLHPFDIPAQPLSGALVSFGRQSGLQISVDSQLLEGRQAPVVRGSMNSEQALGRLLQGSGLVWHYAAPDTLLLEAAPLGQGSALQLGSTQVRSVAPKYQGETTLERKTIEALPAGNGDITSLLKTHPNVQFDNSQLSSKTPGEIDPANISINGAKYWQNLFLVDGVSMNNDIDPVAGNPVSMTDVPGRSQGLALDTDLLEEIRVYDSNISSEYGGFNGGVIEAITRKPSQDLHGKISAQMARSEWTEYHIDERQQTALENSTSASNQPDFEKLIIRATLEGHLTDNFGLLANFSRKTSTIPLKGYSTSYTTPEEGIDKDQERQIDNYFLKSTWQVNDVLDMDLSLTHAPQVNEYFIANGRDSTTKIESGGDIATLRVNWQTPLVKLSNTLSWSQLENSRDSEKNYYKGWRWSETKNWSSATPTTQLSSEGSYGDIKQRQTSYSYKLNADWSDFELFGSQHQLRSGFEIAKQNVYYERLEQFQYGSTLNLANACVETEWCSIGYSPSYPTSAGQAFRRLNTYDAGKIEFDTLSWGMYLQDEIALGRLTLRPGVRLDGDDYMDQETLAPRFAADYDLFGDGTTRLVGGVNRYYGRNMFAYRLYDGRATLLSYQTRTSSTSAWSAPIRTVNNTKFNQVDIPYDDELAFGIEQIWWDTRFAFKYVNRKGRDQIVRTQGRYIGQPSTDPGELSTSYYTYTNRGESETDVFTFTLSPLKSLDLWGTRNTVELALDWTDVTSSNIDYATNFTEDDLADPIIQYEGSFIRKSERPADNFNRPWTARLTTITEIPQWHLGWSNFLRHRAGYRKIGDSGRNIAYQGEMVAVWEEQSYSSTLVWDTRLSWELPIHKDQAAFVNLDVSNLLDRVVVSDISSSNIPTYEVGRQFMVEVGYRF